MRAWFVLAALLVLGCSVDDGVLEDLAPAEPISVGVTVVALEEVAQPVFGTGTIAPHKMTDIGPRMNGIIDAIYVEVGDRVEEGEALFRTRAAAYEIRVREAQSETRLTAAEAERSQREFERIRQLHVEGAASDQRLDEVQTALEVAAARRDRATAALAQARQDLADTTVRAPYRAVITKRHVHEGTMMSTMLSGSPVVQLMKIDWVGAIVQVPEVYLSLIHLGTPARVRVDGMNRDYESEVRILNDFVDPESRAFEVRVPLENSDYEIKPGLFAEVELFPDAREVVVLERAALLGGESARYVFVEEQGEAVRRAVVVRELDATRVEVVSGLAPGARALVGPKLNTISEGDIVAVEVAHADR